MPRLVVSVLLDDRDRKGEPGRALLESVEAVLPRFHPGRPVRALGWASAVDRRVRLT